MFKILFETRRLKFETRRCCFSRVLGASTFCRDIFGDVWWNTLTMKKNYTNWLTRTMESAFYLWYCGFLHFFDNYHWIINGLHCKELQLQWAVDMSHHGYRNLQATEISKLQLIIALYVIYIWLIVFILASYTLSSLRPGHFMTKKDWHDIILLYDK